MNDKELRKLGRADLVEILCRQRELIDQLDEKNRQLQARAEKAEAALKECAASREEEQKRAEEDAALREDMRRLMEKVESMSHSMQRCTESTRALEAAGKRRKKFWPRRRQKRTKSWRRLSRTSSGAGRNSPGNAKKWCAGRRCFAA